MRKPRDVLASLLMSLEWAWTFWPDRTDKSLVTAQVVFGRPLRVTGVQALLRQPFAMHS